jgi:hypothetical protein
MEVVSMFSLADMFVFFGVSLIAFGSSVWFGQQ